MGVNLNDNLFDAAVITALRCEYYRVNGSKPADDAAFWRFAALFLATAYWYNNDDEYSDCIHTLFDKNINLMAALYPDEFEAIKADSELAEIYLD